MAGRVAVLGLVPALLLCASASAAPQGLTTGPEVDDVRRSYLPPQGYLPPQSEDVQASALVEETAAAAPVLARVSAPGPDDEETAAQCSHSFHSFLCGRSSKRRRPGAERSEPQATFQQLSRLLPDPAPNPQFQATFLQPSKLRPPQYNALTNEHQNCTSHAVLHVRPPQRATISTTTTTVPTTRKQFKPQAEASYLQPLKVEYAFKKLEPSNHQNCSSDASLHIRQHFSSTPSTITTFVRQYSTVAINRKLNSPSTEKPFLYNQVTPVLSKASSRQTDFKDFQRDPSQVHDPKNCSLSVQQTTTQPPELYRDFPSPAAAFESIRIVPLSSHPPGCTCGADHVSGSTADATFVNPERVPPPRPPQRPRTTQKPSTTTRPTTTTTTTTTTTRIPEPRALEPLAAAPEPAVAAPPKKSWDESDSCSHAFHSFLCRKPAGAASGRRKPLGGQPIAGDSSFISSASLPAPRRVSPAEPVPTRQTPRTPTPAAAPVRPATTTTPDPPTTRTTTTPAPGPASIEPQAAQDAPVVVVPKPQGDDGLHHHHHHHHEGRDICSDPFHSFLCQKVDTSKRRRVYGRLPAALPRPSDSPQRAIGLEPSGDSTFIRPSAVAAPGNLIPSQTSLPVAYRSPTTARPQVSTIAAFLSSPVTFFQRRKYTSPTTTEVSPTTQRPTTTEKRTTSEPQTPLPCQHNEITSSQSYTIPQREITRTIPDATSDNANIIPFSRSRPNIVIAQTSTVQRTTYTTTERPTSFTSKAVDQVYTSSSSQQNLQRQRVPIPSAFSNQVRPVCSNSGGRCASPSALPSDPAAKVVPQQLPVSTTRGPTNLVERTTQKKPSDPDVLPAAAQNDEARLLPQSREEHDHDHHDHHHHHHHEGDICKDPFHSFLCAPTKPRRRFDGRPQKSGAARPSSATLVPAGSLEGANSFLSSATIRPSNGSPNGLLAEKQSTALFEPVPDTAQQQEVLGYLYPEPNNRLLYPYQRGALLFDPKRASATSIKQRNVITPSTSFSAEISKDYGSSGANIKRDTANAQNSDVSHLVSANGKLPDGEPTRWSWAQKDV